MSNPGLSLMSLEKMLSLNRSTLRYHLNFLSRDTKVWSKIENGQRCYFPSNASEGPALNGLDLNTLTKFQSRVLRLIRDNPGVPFKNLQRTTRINPNTLTYTINKLRERNLIWKVKVQGVVGYEYKSREKIYDEMFRLLLAKYLNDEIDKDTFLRLKAELERGRK